MFGEFGCLPMIAYGKNKVSSAFKMLARARNIDFETANEISKQLQSYELDKKHAIENNADDDDYDVDEHIHLSDYVTPEHLTLIKESEKYQGIIVNVSPHPCGHITYHKDLREEIGVIRLKAKTGGKEPKLCVCIDGTTADNLNYVKSDLLRVDVVKLISDTFKAIEKPVMPVDELLSRIDGDNKIWSLYANGFTQCLNQCERPASTQKCMQFKPQNIVELSSFVAAIRPGFKSMLSVFLSRTPFKYGIDSLDELLKIQGMTGNSANSAFLLYDEQVLQILIAGGMDGATAYKVLKAIKKKKADKVLAAKSEFKTGFSRYLKEKENATEEQASEIVEKIWRIIEDGSNYLFCAAHSFAYACDSAYCAYLKAYYPYEFYTTALKLYTAKGNKDKIALLIDEMRRYVGIRLTPGRFGQDNRDWLSDKEKHTISQSLSSMKFISQQAAEDLNNASRQTYGSFADLCYKLMCDTCIDERQMRVLITTGYFEMFGKSRKLMHIYEEFKHGKNRLTKTVKSYEKRLAALREYERGLKDLPLPIEDVVKAENEFIGLCFSCDPNAKGEYLITEIDDRYSIKIRMYNIFRGRYTPYIRMRKKDYEQLEPKIGEIILITNKEWCKIMPKRIFSDGKTVSSNSEKETWLHFFIRKQQAA